MKAASVFTDLNWEPMLCIKCGRLLYKRTSTRPLLPGEGIAAKCRACNEITFLFGRPVEETTLRTATT